MMTSFIKRGSIMAMLLSIAICAFAEDAPVYDADNYPPQFDGQSEPQAAARPAITSGEQQESSTVQLTLAQRVGKVEQQINNMQHADDAAKLNEMQSQIQALRGQVEELAHQLQESQNQQKKLYADLDKRMAQKTVVAAAPVTAKAQPTAEPEDSLSSEGDMGTLADAEPAKKAKPVKVEARAQPNVAEEQQIYQTAYNLIKAKKFNDAAATLQNMLQKYPSGQFAGNAHYWLGQLYSLMGKNDQAVTEFNTVVKTYPEYPKVSDAQLKLGLAYSALQKWSDAKSAFKAVINHYPGSTSSHLASEQLKQIQASGH